jgi:hypothetical protein
MEDPPSPWEKVLLTRMEEMQVLQRENNMMLVKIYKTLDEAFAKFGALTRMPMFSTLLSAAQKPAKRSK